MKRRDLPLGGPAYGSIPHLPGSRTGPSDRHLSPERARALLSHRERAGDRVIVEEKLDGSCVAAARIGDEILALGREGALAAESANEARRHFAAWVAEGHARFLAAIEPGERLVGEWLLLAHGTRYTLSHEPFVAFDLMRGRERAPRAVLRERAARGGFVTPWAIHEGDPIGIDAVLARLGDGRHGADGPAEGAVWRLERNESVVLVAKYVRAGKVDGILLPEATGGPPVYNDLPLSRRGLRGPMPSIRQDQPPPSTGTYEAHLTVAARDDAELRRFGDACAALGVKCVLIELARGRDRFQPMTASYHRGEASEVRREIGALAEALVARGFEITRVKIEAVGDNPEIPATDADAAARPAGYFEFHVKLTLPGGVEPAGLRARCEAAGAHLSRNARKALANGDAERFVTLRVPGAGRDAADARFAALLASLRETGLALSHRLREYTVHDTNTDLDRGWLS